MSESLALFINEASKIPSPRVLELGTKRSKKNRSTMHKTWVPHAKEFLGTDFISGTDVDIVSDIHTLSKITGENQYDIIISCSTFEHIQYPWIAVEEISRTLKLGGLFFMQTHHSFPLHSYPNDYWRFSTEALETLFCKEIGFDVLGVSYDFKSHVFSWRLPWLIRHRCYLNSYLTARKTNHLTDNFSWRDCIKRD